MAYSRKNSALKFYFNGRRAASMHGLVDLDGRFLSPFEDAEYFAAIVLKRRAEPLVKREIRSVYNVKARDLSGKIRIETGLVGNVGRPRNGYKASSEFISVWASARRLPLMAFDGRWAGRDTSGATASIIHGSSKTYAHAFSAPLRVAGNRGEQLAKRVGPYRESKYGRYKGQRRQMVTVLRGPSPFDMISRDEHGASRILKNGIITELRAVYMAELKRQWKLARAGNG